MAIASNFLIGANDEHGLNPPTAGKRTPIMPYIDRSFYENEFNRRAKLQFIIACLRCGFNTFDVKPEIQDISITSRIRRINSTNLSLLVTFAYNAFGTGSTFNQSNGFEVYYSQLSRFPTQSRELSEEVYSELLNFVQNNGRGVNTINVSVLTSVNCPSTLIEAGFMTNFDEAKLMQDPDYIIQIADGACAGVCNYLDVPYIARDDLSGYPTLRRGSRGNKVKLLQYYLIYNGYDLSPDGVFGSQTYNAVINFQQISGLTVDGIVGNNTWRALITPQGKLSRVGDKGANIVYLQQKLLSKLYPIGNIDGVFGSTTLNNVKQFQQENGLVADGIVGPATWSVLYQIGGGRPLP